MSIERIYRSRWRKPASPREGKSPLDRYNDKLAAEGHCQLHPTKGYRRISPIQSRAASITAERKAGYFNHWTLGRMKQAMREARTL